MVTVAAQRRTYSPGSLERRIATLDSRDRRLEEDEELSALRAAQTAHHRPLSVLPQRQREWLRMWELCQSQRYGQGMTLGSLVHSEIWNNLEKCEYEGREKERAFRVILGIDEIFREQAEKEQGGD